jgi:hypothetical protein
MDWVVDATDKDRETERPAARLSRNVAGRLCRGASVRTVTICDDVSPAAPGDIDDESVSIALLTSGNLDFPDLTINIVASTFAAMSRVSLTPTTGGPFRITQS